VQWLADGGSDLIEPDRLDRIGHLGQFTTATDLTTRAVDPADDGPQAYLAIQGADTEPLRPHFHGVDQFSWFAHGAGRVGRNAVAPGMVQYADRLTPYGPLTPGPAGMSYLTLRPRHDPGACFMPESRDELAGRLADSQRGAAGRRAITIDVAAVDSAGAEGWVDVVADADELRIAVTDHPDGTPSEPVAGGGAYVVVVTGALHGPDGPLPAGTFTWCPAGTTAELPRAAEPGTRVALLQFPRPA
jgi:hypothetical protein